jgi:hypothetical protein
VTVYRAARDPGKGGDMMTEAAAKTVGTLSWNDALLAAGLLLVAALLAGGVVLTGRKMFAGKATASTEPAGSPGAPDGDFIRSWIAVILVLGLLTFCAFAFAINDTSLRSTLIGGLIASVGSAVAFYFSTKSADKARQDVVAAAAGTEPVPNLSGKTVQEASEALGRTSLRLAVRDGAVPAGHVSEQFPAASSDAPKGSAVQVTVT